MTRLTILLATIAIAATSAPAAADTIPPTDHLDVSARVTISIQIAEQTIGATPGCDLHVYAHELEHILGYTNGRNTLYPCYQRFLPIGQGYTWRRHHPNTPWSTLT